MSIYYYSYAADFLYGLNPAQFHQEILAAGTISVDLISVDVIGDQVSVTFVSPLSTDEQAALNTLVQNHRPAVPVVAPYIVSKIREETVDTGENFMSEGIEVMGATGPNVTTTIMLTWPINFCLLGFSTQTDEVHRGSMIEAAIAPNAIIGVLIADCASGATGIYVSDTVIDHLMVGYFLDLFTGVSSENLGRVVSIDKTTGYVVTEFQPSQDYTAYPPTYVRMTIYFLQNYRFAAPGFYSIGDRRIGGSYLPAETPVRIVITNASSQALSWLAKLEYYY